jgi:hypothetical protein
VESTRDSSVRRVLSSRQQMKNRSNKRSLQMGQWRQDLKSTMTSSTTSLEFTTMCQET